jgi:hypothetical protein
MFQNECPKKWSLKISAGNSSRKGAKAAQVLADGHDLLPPSHRDAEVLPHGHG